MVLGEPMTNVGSRRPRCNSDSPRGAGPRSESDSAFSVADYRARYQITDLPGDSMTTETGAIRNFHLACLGLSLFSGLAAYADGLGPAPTPLPEKLEVRLAESAAPAKIRSGAGLYLYRKGEGLVRFRESKNGFNC